MQPSAAHTTMPSLHGEMARKAWCDCYVTSRTFTMDALIGSNNGSLAPCANAKRSSHLPVRIQSCSSACSVFSFVGTQRRARNPLAFDTCSYSIRRIAHTLRRKISMIVIIVKVTDLPMILSARNVMGTKVLTHVRRAKTLTREHKPYTRA